MQRTLFGRSKPARTLKLPLPVTGALVNSLAMASLTPLTIYAFTFRWVLSPATAFRHLAAPACLPDRVQLSCSAKAGHIPLWHCKTAALAVYCVLSQRRV